MISWFDFYVFSIIDCQLIYNNVWTIKNISLFTDDELTDTSKENSSDDAGAGKLWGSEKKS